MIYPTIGTLTFQSLKSTVKIFLQTSYEVKDIFGDHDLCCVCDKVSVIDYIIILTIG